MGDKLKEILAQLHTGLAEELLKRVQSGDATPAELSVARQMLKDNGIDSVPKGDDPMNELAKSLPDLDEPSQARH